MLGKLRILSLILNSFNVVGCTVGNLVLRRCASGYVKRDFRPYIRRYIPPNESFEYGFPNSNSLSTQTGVLQAA